MVEKISSFGYQQVGRIEQWHNVILFCEAENLFLDDRLDDARTIYQALFGLIEAFRESADVSLGDAVDIREARARYCRCVYETVKESEKHRVFAGAMDTDWIGRYEVN